MSAAKEKPVKWITKH